MTQRDLIKGNIYVSSYPGQGEYIVRWEGKIGSSGPFVNSQNKNFAPGESYIVESNGFMEYRDATETEKRWLNLCIDRKMYAPMEDLFKEPEYSIY